MQTYIIDPSNIYAVWYERWSGRFASEWLGVEMASNSRVADRATARMLRSFGVDERAKFTKAEHAALSLFEHDSARLITLCGLVLNGAALRNCVSREAFARLAGSFSDRDLRIALGLHDLHPGKSRFDADMDRLTGLVQRNGEACVNAWRRHAGDQVRLRLELMRDDRDGSDTETLMQDTKLAIQIVEAVCLAVLEQEDSHV